MRREGPNLKGFYRCEFKIISRAKGRSAPGGAAYIAGAKVATRSATASAAYLSGTRMVDERTGKTFSYTNKHGVAHSEVMLPAGADERLRNPETLWNAAEKAEKRKDAQVARLAILSLPKEFTPEQRLEATRGFLAGFVAEGMAVHFAMHDPHHGSDNFHAHALMTMRQVTAKGFAAKKSREWNERSWMTDKRAAWSTELNARAQEYGHTLKFDHRSAKAQQLEKGGVALEGVSLPLRQFKEGMRGKVRNVVPGLTPAEVAFMNAYSQADAKRQRAMAHRQGPWTATRKAALAKVKGKDGYFDAYERLDCNARRVTARGLQLRATRQQAEQAFRATMRTLQTTTHLSPAVGLKERKERLQARREALRRSREQGDWLQLLQGELQRHDVREAGTLFRLEFFLEAFGQAMEARERQKLKEESQQLQAEQRTMVEGLKRTQMARIFELQAQGRSHEAAALQANMVMFAMPAGDEATKASRKELARFNLHMAQEADRLLRVQERERRREEQEFFE